VRGATVRANDLPFSEPLFAIKVAIEFERWARE
jgi:hypothetical protein